jgi:hypothetical protein
MNYLGSFYEKYATKTWVFTKDYLSHINKFTDFYKNRLPDTASYLRMAFEEIIDGKKVESGYLSELHKLTFKDRAESSVGGAIDLSVIEEAGVFPNLLDVLEFMKPATMDGSFTTGLIIAYGSVGDLDKCEGLKKIFYEPEANDFMAYDNIWDDVEIAKNKKCGYFVPEYICLKPYIDDNGNSDIDSSLKYLDGERAKQKKKSVRQYLTYISQHPIKPQEAFLSKSVNKFPVELLTKWLAELETVGSIGNVGYGLELLNDKGVVKPKILGISSPYEKYPIEQTDDGIEGSIWIYEPPSPEKQTGLYIAMVDSVDQDAAPTSSSIFSLTIYKRTNNNALDQTDRKIVATYNGRRPTAEEMYDIAINLCEYYNAKLLVENANVGIVNHFRNKNKEYILQEQMDEIKGLNPTSKVSRSYGFHPTREVILNGDNLIIKYLTEVIGYIYTDDTKTTIAKEILGYTRIKDKGLIRELIAYNDEDNFDRITSFRGCLLYEQALYQRRVIKEESVNSPMSAAAKLADKFLIGARMVRMGLKNKNF